MNTGGIVNGLKRLWVHEGVTVAMEGTRALLDVLIALQRESKSSSTKQT
jgi:hypothetical protein